MIGNGHVSGLEYGVWGIDGGDIGMVASCYGIFETLVRNCYPNLSSLLVNMYVCFVRYFTFGGFMLYLSIVTGVYLRAFDKPSSVSPDWDYGVCEDGLIAGFGKTSWISATELLYGRRRL